MSRVIGIVQARMGASRLPNKMMLWFHGYPVVEWIFHRVSQCQKLDQLIFALPEGQKDDILAEYLKSIGAVVFRGSEQDVVARFYGAAKSAEATHVVRICADNPLICASEVDRLVDFYFESNTLDYVYNHIPLKNAYPDGLGAEMISFTLLEEIHQKAIVPSQREHVLNYVRDSPGSFRIGTFDPLESWLFRPDLKLDLDTPDDYQKLLRLPLKIDMTTAEVVRLFPVPGVQQ